MNAVALIPLVLALWVVVWAGLIHATRALPPPELLSEIAYREGRQCFTPVYDWSGSAPERCVFPDDHYGECALSTRIEPKRRPRPALVEAVDPW
jgi:hypothetical protein